MDVALLSRVTHEGYFSLLTCSRPALCIPGLVSRALSCWELSVGSALWGPGWGIRVGPSFPITVA